MPFKEALFWIGITVLGAGLFFVVDPDKTILGIVSIAVGLMCSIYSVYQHHYPNKIARNQWWILLLVLTWFAIGYDYYDRQRQPSIPEFDTYQRMVDRYGGDTPNSCFMQVKGGVFLPLSKKYKLAVTCFVWDGTIPVLDAPHLQVGNLYDISDNEIYLKARWGDEFNQYRSEQHSVGIAVALLLVPNGVQTSQFNTLRQARLLGVRIPESDIARPSPF
jgi:hypothetical protein